MDWLRQLDQVFETDSSVVGAKAADLGQFNQLSQQLSQRAISANLLWQVPQGFVLTVDAFRRHFEEAAGGPIIHELQRPRLHFDLLRQTLSAFDELFDNAQHSGSAYVTVRRSEPLAQTPPAPSRAHGTYYFITRERLAETIVDCWMSQLKRGADGDEAQPIAILIMRMVNADCSGSAYSQDPSGHYPGHSLVEASWGLGATQVDGRVQADQFYVSQQQPRQVNQQRIGLKQLYMPGDLANPHLARLETVPQPKQQRATLLPKQALAVDALCQVVATTWDCDVAIDWAFEGEKLYLLQAQRVSAKSTPQDDAVNPPKRGAWVFAQPLLDGSRHALTPLSVDLYRRLLPGYVKFVRGRAYVNLKTLRRWLPFSGSDAEFCQPLIVPEDNILLGEFSAWRLLQGSLRAGFNYLSQGIFGHRVLKLNQAQLPRFRHRLHQLAQQELDPLQTLMRGAMGSHPFHAVYQYPVRLEAFSHRRQIYISLLYKLLRKHNPDDASANNSADNSDAIETFCADVLESHNRLQSDVDELAALISAHSGLARLPVTRLAARLQEIPDAHPLALALQSFQRRHGHRFTGYLELANPRWREAPQTWFATLLPRIRQSQLKTQLQARNPAALKTPEEDPQAVLSIDYRLRLLLRTPTARWLGTKLVRRCAHYGELQDAARQQTVSLLDQIREQLCSIERQLIHQRRLFCSGDLFYLQWPELVALQNGEAQWGDLEHRVLTRRRQHRAANRQVAAATLNLDLAPPLLRATSGTVLAPPKLTDTVDAVTADV